MMQAKRKICIFTGSRADFGLLKPLIRLVQEHENLTSEIFASGSHLSSEQGRTLSEIKASGFKNITELPILNDSAPDTQDTVIRSCARGMELYSKALRDFDPDISVILGDRYEAFTFGWVNFMQNRPVAHLHGGEVTEGANDDAFRHCLSKMSWWHFCASQDFAKRLERLGEDPQRIFNVGATSTDNFLDTEFLSLPEVEAALSRSLQPKTYIITFHPVTHNDQENQAFEYLLAECMKEKDSLFIMTKPNADWGHKEILQTMDKYCKKDPQKFASYDSLGSKLYLSLLRFANGVLGNSSSGLYEAPLANIVSVNIGSRQDGRPRASSVIDVPALAPAFTGLFQRIEVLNLKLENSEASYPFGRERTAPKILDILLNEPLPKNLGKKFFESL